MDVLVESVYAVLSCLLVNRTLLLHSRRVDLHPLSLVLVLGLQRIENAVIQRHVALSQRLVVRSGIDISLPVLVHLLLSQNLLVIRGTRQWNGERLLSHNALELGIQEDHLHHGDGVHLSIALHPTSERNTSGLRLPEPHVLPIRSNDARPDGHLLEQLEGAQILDIGGAHNAVPLSKPPPAEKADGQVVAPIIAVQIVRRVVHVAVVVNVAKPDTEGDFAVYR